MMSHPETEESNSLMREKWGNEQTAETRGWLVVDVLREQKTNTLPKTLDLLIRSICSLAQAKHASPFSLSTHLFSDFISLSNSTLYQNEIPWMQFLNMVVLLLNDHLASFFPTNSFKVGSFTLAGGLKRLCGASHTLAVDCIYSVVKQWSHCHPPEWQPQMSILEQKHCYCCIQQWI